MKMNLLITTFTLAILTPALAGTEGITASPKFREGLNRQSPAPAVARIQITDPALTLRTDDGILASPKLRERLDAQNMASTSHEGSTHPAPGAACSGYKVVASPRLTQLWPQVSTQCCGAGPCMLTCSR